MGMVESYHDTCVIVDNRIQPTFIADMIQKNPSSFWIVSPIFKVNKNDQNDFLSAD